MSRLPAGTILDGHRAQAGVTVADLWLDCFAIGGQLSPDDLQSVLSGTATPNDVDYDVIAQALNDTFTDSGEDHPVPYAEDFAR
jgi:hypothetical protein